MIMSRSRIQRMSGQLAVATACAIASAGALAALPQFTFNPGAMGLSGAPITADNILISTFATATVDSSGAFTQSGYLPITGFQLGGSTLTPAGLNTDYGLYIAFTATGTTSVGDPTTTFTFGNLETLSYTLYGYNGTATFNVIGNTPTETASGEVALATGTLMTGNVFTIPTGDQKFSASATATLTVQLDAPAFFSSPNPFYSMALTTFSNTPAQIEPFLGGFNIRQGGGALNFAPVPEPGSMAMLTAGLAVVGFVFLRRQRNRP